MDYKVIKRIKIKTCWEIYKKEIEYKRLIVVLNNIIMVKILFIFISIKNIFRKYNGSSYKRKYQIPELNK